MAAPAARRRGRPRPGRARDAKARLGLVARPASEDRPVPSPIAIALLLIANAIPLVGAAWWGWDLYAILLLYWIESGIVGALNIPRMRMAEGPIVGPDGRWRHAISPIDPATPEAARRALIPFFVGHYGIFWGVHGVFVLFGLPLLLGAFGAGAGPSSLQVDAARTVGAVLVGSLGLALSHGASFLFNYAWGGEYRRANVVSLALAPYARVVVLHVTILAGAFAVHAVGSPMGLLLLLVGTKTVIDLLLHLREHRRLARSRP